MSRRGARNGGVLDSSAGRRYAAGAMERNPEWPAAAVTGGAPPVELQQPSPLPFTRVSGRKRSLFYIQFARQLEAGVAPVRCLQTLGGHRGFSGRLARAALDMAAHIQGGGSLASAFARHPSYFPATEVRMLEAAERSGKIAETMLRIAAFLDVLTRFWRKFVTGLFYPCFLVLAAACGVPLLMAILFDAFGGPVRLLTLQAISLAVLFGLVLAALTVWRSFASLSGPRVLIHSLLLAIPWFGGMVRRLAVSRFTDMLECLYSAGVPTVEAVTRGAEACGNAAIARRLVRAAPRIQEGSTITGALAASGVLPAICLNMIEVGEDSGKLQETLAKVAADQRHDAEVTIERMAKILPFAIYLLIVLAMAILIVSIAMGVIRSLNQLGP